MRNKQRRRNTRIVYVRAYSNGNNIMRTQRKSREKNGVRTCNYLGSCTAVSTVRCSLRNGKSYRTPSTVSGPTCRRPRPAPSSGRPARAVRISTCGALAMIFAGPVGDNERGDDQRLRGADGARDGPCRCHCPRARRHASRVTREDPNTEFRARSPQKRVVDDPKCFPHVSPIRFVRSDYTKQNAANVPFPHYFDGRTKQT